MLNKPVFAGAIAIACSAVFSSAAFAQESSQEQFQEHFQEQLSATQVQQPSEQTLGEQQLSEQPNQLDGQLVAQQVSQGSSDPSTPSTPDSSSLEDNILEPLNEGENVPEAATEETGTPVTFSVRLNTELYVNGGDLYELWLPVRYNPSDRLAIEASPVIKYFPESTTDEMDYGFKFAVEYRL